MESDASTDRDTTEYGGGSYEDQDVQEEDSDSTTSSEHMIEEEPLPPARDHSYLPGASHPLFPDQLLEHRQSSSGSIRHAGADEGQSELIELAVLELPGVVLFPGSTLPIRLHDQGWIEYLGRKIDASRAVPGLPEQVRFGVITRKEPERDRRRQSWARQRIGPQRLQRLSQQLIRELGDLDNLSEEDEVSSDDGIAPEPVPIPRRPARRESPPRQQQQRSPQGTSRNPYIGRIGTIATVTYTHGDATIDAVDIDDPAADSMSRVWRSHSEGQLVVTALGTGRFRIAATQEQPGQMNRIQYHDGRLISGVRTFLVEELDDEPLSIPPHVCRLNFAREKCNVSAFVQHHDQIIHHLSVISPIPDFVHQIAWPWKLVATIRQSMDNIPTFAGLSKVLPSLDDNVGNESRSLLDPLQFSFWMASNLPLKEQEKLELLEMHSTVERLMHIRDEVAKQETVEALIQCKSCMLPLSRASHMFTVGGAEGTTGAYVNEFGFVHQTITVREIDEDEVMYSGGPQTRDSWFPGYSWTIMSCAFCGSHLGWKFRLVGQPHPDPDRPEYFYGLSGGSVATIIPSTRASRMARRSRGETEIRD